MPPLSALGVSGDPTYTHSWKSFGRIRSPAAVYWGSGRAGVCALLLESDCTRKAVAITPLATNAVIARSFGRIAVLLNSADMVWKVFQSTRHRATSLDAILSVLRDCERT